MSNLLNFSRSSSLSHPPSVSQNTEYDFSNDIEDQVKSTTEGKYVKSIYNNKNYYIEEQGITTNINGKSFFCKMDSSLKKESEYRLIDKRNGFLLLFEESCIHKDIANLIFEFLIDKNSMMYKINVFKSVGNNKNLSMTYKKKIFWGSHKAFPILMNFPYTFPDNNFHWEKILGLDLGQESLFVLNLKKVIKRLVPDVKNEEKINCLVNLFIARFSHLIYVEKRFSIEKAEEKINNPKIQKEILKTIMGSLSIVYDNVENIEKSILH